MHDKVQERNLVKVQTARIPYSISSCESESNSRHGTRGMQALHLMEKGTFASIKLKSDEDNKSISK